jgi:hypothetical protein
MFSNHNKEQQKIYILQNKIWNDEIIKYIKSDTNRDYNLNLINNNKFIIRLYDRNEYKSEQHSLHRILKKCPNIAEIFLMIKKRDLPLISNDRKELVDIEKKYDKNINDAIFDKHKILDFLKQMVYCQLNLFYNCGVVHNNIHSGNIFIENNDDIVKIEHIDETFDYIYKKNTIYYNHIGKKIISSTRYILSDFTKSRTYDIHYSCGICYEDGYDISLLKNLEDTFKLGKKLFDCEELNNVEVPEETKKIYDLLLRKKYDREFEYHYDNYDEFKNETIKLCFNYINNILIKFNL